MGTFTIYCKKPQNYVLKEEYFCCSIKEAEHKKQTLKKIYTGEDLIIKRREAYVFVFEHCNAQSIRNMVRESNNKFHLERLRG